MINKFNKYINDNQLFKKDDKILLAISGGIDSMVMLHLFLKSDYNFSIAHCNFQLREKDSNLDEKLVTDFAIKNDIEYFVKKFNTLKYSKDKSISIQMAARDLRYDWFNSLKYKNNFKYIATAHHLDDQSETFFINLIRGTGIAGLHGILPKSNNVIRPLLFATREEIKAYQTDNEVIYREDKSNKADKYLRNYIRHNILNEFYKLNNNFSVSLDKTIRIIRDVESVYRNKIENQMANLLDVQNDKIIINVNELKKLNPLKPYLYEFLNLYNFNETTVDNIYNSIKYEQSGTQFYSSSNRLIKDRENLILVPFEDEEAPKVELFRIKQNFEQINTPVNLKFEKTTDNEIIKNSNIAQFDLEKLNFPLELRRWEKGDYFYPLGMNQKKKLSDFFIDEKISVYDKETAWILTSGKDIIWIVGHRIDDRFKIDNNTKEVYKITYTK